MHRTRSLTAIVTAAVALLAAGPAGAHVIAPGALAAFQNDQCTLNFVFDGTGPMAGRVFIGTAAHCTAGEPGEQVLMGGDSVKPGEVIGRVAVVGPFDPQSTAQDETADDWALIEIASGHRAEVDPAMLGHADFPSRVTGADEMSEGDVLQYSGYGTATQATATTREQRQGEWTGGDARLYGALAPHVTPGDSGGPVVDVKTGGAVGLVSGILGACPSTCNTQGPTITGLVEGAAAQGFPVQLRAAGRKAPARPAAAEPQPSPPADAPATQAPAPQSAPAAKLRVRGGCLRRGRLTLRITANVALQSVRLTAPHKQGLRPDRPVRLRGLRGLRVRIAVSARTRDGRRVTARATFRAC
jgi:hypothetical protein